MFALGVLCIVLGALRRRRGWQLSGAFFLFLSMDDAAMIHERIGWLMRLENGPVRGRQFHIPPQCRGRVLRVGGTICKV